EHQHRLRLVWVRDQIHDVRFVEAITGHVPGAPVVARAQYGAPVADGDITLAVELHAGLDLTGVTQRALANPPKADASVHAREDAEGGSHHKVTGIAG